jgi:uncharacterized DUF497 family protein
MVRGLRMTRALDTTRWRLPMARRLSAADRGYIVRTINVVKIEFDAVKDLVNRGKHGVSLADAAQLAWNSLLAKRDTRRNSGEAREIGYGVWNRRLHCVAFVRRVRGAIRIIGLRKPTRVT